MEPWSLTFTRQQECDKVPFSRMDRKVALLRLGQNHTAIAAHLGVERSLVSHVMAGRRWSGSDARRVMEYIAGLLGAPLAEVFPGGERRGSHPRRDTDRASEAA